MGGGQSLGGVDLRLNGGACFICRGELLAQSRDDATLLWEGRKRQSLPANLAIRDRRVEGALHQVAQAAHERGGPHECEEVIGVHLPI